MTTARTNTPTLVPGIPKPPADISPALRRYLESLSEAVEIRLGRRGDPRDRAVTLRELIDSGLASELSNRPFVVGQGGNPGFGPETDTTVPTAPTGFTATGGYSLVTLFWDYPNYGPHAHTEVWRHDQNIIGDAQLIGISSGVSFVDPVGEGASYYYWVRHVSLYDVYGPYNSASGTLAQTALNVAVLLEVLNGAITESQLFQSLGERIDLIDANASVVNSVAYRVAQETADRVAAINQEIADRTTAINNEVTARTAAIAAETAARSAAISSEAAARAASIDTAVQGLQSQINDLSAIAEYNNSTSYSTGEIVTYNGFLYRATTSTTGNLPTNTSYWELLGEYSSLGDFVNANAAAIVQINTIDATSTSAASQAIQAVTATVNNPTTGVAATASALGSLSSAVNDSSTGLSATVSRVSGLESTINNPTTGVAATAAALDLVEATVNDGTNGVVAVANRTGVLETAVNNPTTGLAATRSTLINDYYTKTAADSAIAAATLNLVTQTNLNTTLGSYVTNATLTSNYYTESETDSAISAATSSLVSNTSLTNTLGNYVSNSNLTTNYYTKTETDSAISVATSSLVSSTALNTALSDYVTNSTLTTNYYTRTATDGAISAATQNLVSSTSLNTTLDNYATNSTLTNNYYTKTATDSAISTATQNLVSNTTLNNYVTNSSLTTNYYTKTETDSAISAQTNTLSSQINVKNRTYRQTSAPTTGLVTGDVWFDSDDGNKSYRWSGTAWVATDDTRIAGTASNLTNNYYTKTATDSAIAAASLTLQSAINVKNRSFYQASAPAASGLIEGDLWFESDNNNKSYRWNGSSWVAVDDVRIANTAASLASNYYTKTQTDSAISVATQSLVSTTSLNSTLGSYVTNSTLTNNYYTATQTNSAISAATQNLVSSSTLNNYATNATLTNNYYTKTATDSAISSASNTLTSSFNNTLSGYATNVAVQQNYYTKASGETLEGRYTVKIDANGYVAGYGLAVTANNGTPTSEFLIRADRFAIGSPGQSSVVPFTVQATATTINGVAVPAGVYINDAYIRNGTITNAKIGNAAIDDAKIASLSADKIVAGTIDTARLAIDNVTLDSYYDSSIGRNRLRIRDLGVDTAKINDAAITFAKIGNAEVGTLKIAGNAITQPQTYTAADRYVTSAISVTAGGYAYVGYPNGDYIYEPEFGGYYYVGSGNGDYAYSSGGSISGGHVAIETPQINVGVDSTAAVQIVFYGFCDGSLVNDGGQLLYMFVDKYANGSWSGYQQVASSRVGARTGGGNTQSVFSIAMAHTAADLQNIKVKVLVGSQATHLALGTPSNPTYLRNITISMLGAKR